MSELNPDVNRFWALDYCIYDREHDRRSKIDHLLLIWQTVMHGDELPFRTVPLDSWYTTMKLMKVFEQAGKIYYGVIKANRQVTESPGEP